jgi:hypothetical protein
VLGLEKKKGQIKKLHTTPRVASTAAAGWDLENLTNFEKKGQIKKVHTTP